MLDGFVPVTNRANYNTNKGYYSKEDHVTA